MANHREYIIDRNKRITEMIDSLRNGDTTKATASQKLFYADPKAYAATFGLNLSEEEAFGITSMNGGDLDLLEERLTQVGILFFDTNCSCRP